MNKSLAELWAGRNIRNPTPAPVLLKSKVMKRAILAFAVIVAVAAVISGSIYYYEANHDFSDWMSEPELGNYVKQVEAGRQGQANWQQGHWFTAVEGHWNDGVAEYRIRYGAAPSGALFSWRYFVNMDHDAFSKRIQELGATGFRLVYVDSFKLPDGTRRYQGVWHKIGSSN